MGARVRTIIINSTQPNTLVTFWQKLLGVGVQERSDGITWLEPDTAGGVNIGFQHVQDKLSSHTEAHLDVAVEDMESAAALVAELGGSHLATNVLDSGFEWRVMRDPDGNEFCIFVESTVSP